MSPSRSVFYKYAGGSGLAILEGLRVKITPPNEFNDPFELTPRSKFSITPEKMLGRLKTNPNFYKGVYEKMKADGFPASFEGFIAELPKQIPLRFKQFERLMRQELKNSDMKSLNEASQYFGIFCVSRVPNSIPMWSHYANNHTGIAIGFNFSKIGSGLAGSFEKIKYSKARRGVDPWLQPPNPEWFKQFEETILRKSLDWAYEQEYRRVFRLSELNLPLLDDKGRRHYLLDITGSDIREIIFGCRMDASDERLIKEALLRRPKTFGHVKLFRCMRHETQFTLKIGAA